MSELEGGAGCALYPCGAAAVTNAILAFVQSGDHILMTGAAYEPTRTSAIRSSANSTLKPPITIR
jgi:cystathionine beta-lyase